MIDEVREVRECVTSLSENTRQLREQGMRDSARHAGIAEGRRELASDLCWRYRGVVKAGENEAGHRSLLSRFSCYHCFPPCFCVIILLFDPQLLRTLMT